MLEGRFARIYKLYVVILRAYSRLTSLKIFAGPRTNVPVRPTVELKFLRELAKIGNVGITPNKISGTLS